MQPASRERQARPLGGQLRTQEDTVVTRPWSPDTVKRRALSLFPKDTSDKEIALWCRAPRSVVADVPVESLTDFSCFTDQKDRNTGHEGPAPDRRARVP